MAGKVAKNMSVQPSNCLGININKRWPYHEPAKDHLIQQGECQKTARWVGKEIPGGWSDQVAKDRVDKRLVDRIGNGMPDRVGKEILIEWRREGACAAIEAAGRAAAG